jgi:hypothetical protein
MKWHSIDSPDQGAARWAQSVRSAPIDWVRAMGDGHCRDLITEPEAHWVSAAGTYGHDLQGGPGWSPEAARLETRDPGAIPRLTVRLERSLHLLTPRKQRTLEQTLTAYPGWAHYVFHFVTARAFVRDLAPEYLELFDFYPLDAFRAELFKWLWLQRVGGFWLDAGTPPPLDLEARRLAGPVWLLREEGLSEAAFEALHRMPPPEPQCLWRVDAMRLGMVPGHPLMDAVLDLCVQRAGHVPVAEEAAADVSYCAGAAVLNAACQVRESCGSREARAEPALKALKGPE